MEAYILVVLAVIFSASASPTNGLDKSLADAFVEERQSEAPCGLWTSGARLVGNGNPHQVYYDEQISETLWCDPNGVNDCDEAVGQTFSISIEANLGATIEDWIDGGFAVSYSREDSDQQQCGSHEGGNSCVWYSTAMTSYTVQNFIVNACTGSQDVGDPVIINSPNKNNAGGKGFYCVIGACRSKGQGYWHTNGVAGGPPT